MFISNSILPTRHAASPKVVMTGTYDKHWSTKLRWQNNIFTIIATAHVNDTTSADLSSAVFRPGGGSSRSLPIMTLIMPTASTALACEDIRKDCNCSVKYISYRCVINIYIYIISYIISILLLQ
ncbi:hypothetical protein CEUSTIGMA_g9679.t1 [Chlamydomonas eustigma]|uniref:Uncharacterized protein n=1 Tax=Chlamydomonas eustigma TaxID=1157962 RepID=A0A250XGP4_9CHLO|nr:hypothetical protein CEUSTIGMA_g9679.t1 [Chlamydomonas eustigma]|eukprot:GAX82251.1 hypothetical protein CEUSTIGMA_g9679.t1 [Chlamydomonas eustigma]